MVLGDTVKINEPAQRSPGLTPRELEVLTLASEGLSRREIETQLLLSSSTVRTHFEHIYAKMGVSSNVAAVAYALRSGLIE
jgi:DNA-binding NarL/FixJ family response regulator